MIYIFLVINNFIPEQFSYKYTESDIYYYPGDGNFLDYIHFVEKFPSFDTPDIFGLHDNA